MIDLAWFVPRALTDGVGRDDVELRNIPYREIPDLCAPASSPLLRRYFLFQSDQCDIYLHELLKSDNHRHFHDHPWAFTTILLTGDYVEHTPDGAHRRARGSILHRAAVWRHWIELERPVWTLVITGPHEREWGFWTDHGFTSWRNYGSTYCA
jgi:hypothetical protein